MNKCDQCDAWLKKGIHASKMNLERSFTKIRGELHIGFNSSGVCQTITNFVPETIILAGDGAVEIKDTSLSCWKLLESEMTALGMLGPRAYQNGEDVLTWLAANTDFFSKTTNPEASLKFITDLKSKIIHPLHKCQTTPRLIHCFSCNKNLKVFDSEKTLVITTNWDLGLFSSFTNVIQLHGRCDYPEQAVLPLQNISSLMAQSTDDLAKLNCGILPSTFLQECLEKTKNFIFWGTGLNDYDAALWHFFRGFLARNPKVQLGIATRNNEKSYSNSKSRVTRFFPSIPISDCLCQMLPHGF